MILSGELLTAEELSEALYTGLKEELTEEKETNEIPKEPTCSCEITN